MSFGRYGRPVIWLMITATLFCAIAQNALHQGMPKPVSPRYTLYAIPAAVSLLRGYQHDYTAQMAIAGLFIYHPEGDTDAQIKQQLDMPTPQDVGLWFVSGDDKGLIDLTYGAFLLFGPVLDSIIKAVLLMIGLSVGLFTLQFFRNDAQMASLVAVLSGLYAVLFTIGLTHQSVTIAEPRFFGAIALCSSLHLMLLAGRGRPLSWLEWLLAGAQTCIIVFVIHLRSSEVWQVLAILTFALTAAALRTISWRSALRMAALPTVGLVALTAYKHATFNERYFEQEVSTRVFWHNALLGLAINPVLQKRYGFSTLDDASVTDAVRHHMLQENRTDDAAAIYPRDNYASGNFNNFNWSAYEIEARSFYLYILTQNPGEVVKTYVEIVPQIMLWDIDYLSNRAGVKELPFFGGLVQVVSPDIRREKGMFFTLFRPLPLAAMFAAFFMLLTTRRSPDPLPTIALGTLFLLSLIPPVLATPAIQYVQLPLLLGTSTLYLLTAFVATRLVTYGVSGASSKMVLARR